jgi:hypothetical protein
MNIEHVPFAQFFSNDLSNDSNPTLHEIHIPVSFTRDSSRYLSLLFNPIRVSSHGNFMKLSPLCAFGRRWLDFKEELQSALC